MDFDQEEASFRKLNETEFAPKEYWEKLEKLTQESLSQLKILCLKILVTVK
jgi:hypothetical protein